LPVLALGSSSLRQLWDVHPDEKLIEPAGWKAPKGHPVLELAFSPDGKRLAVTMDDHYDTDGFKTHLLILDVQSPQKAFRQFDLQTCGNFLAWAPGGNALLVCGTVVRLDDGSSCNLLQTPLERASSNVVNSFYWYDTDRVIRSNRLTKDLSCRPLGRWQSKENWAVAATAPSNGWMILQQSFQRAIDGKTLAYSNYAIADRDSTTLTSGIFLPDSYGNVDLQMVPGAAAVCASKGTLKCWTLPGGSPIIIATDLADHVVTRVSSNSPVVIAERWGFSAWNLLKITPEKLDLIVVDIRSGRRLGSVKPRTQHGNYASQSNIRNWYFQYALSPNGDFLAEGGDGELRLFQLIATKR
jgi:WD40 repeat protein